MKKLLLPIFLLGGSAAFCQTPNQILPYSFDFTSRFDRKIYSRSTAVHSAIKPFFSDDPTISGAIDSAFGYAADSVRRSWAHRKLFHEHLVQVEKDDYSFFADYLPDLQVGKESENDRSTWLNTRGLQAGGTIGRKFSFYTSFYESQAKLPGYLDRIVTADSIISGQSFESRLLAGRARQEADWAYSTARLSYTPSRYVNFQLGHDKNFIGDGYRSVMLSDFSANYPFLSVTATLGRVRYMTMWAQFQDLHAPKLSYQNGFRKKWGVFHYLDWNVNDRLSLGLFEAIIWQAADATGRRGFDFSYLNPIILLRPIERQNGSPDNALLGINAKYELLPWMALYGQFVLDELSTKEFFRKEGYWANKWAMQAGVRGGIGNGLNYLAEVNIARPFMYTETEPINNYAHYSQPLAHPMGANFKEFLTAWSYRYARFNLSFLYNTAIYGIDGQGQNIGHDIYKSYDTRESEYGNRIGQGIRTSFNYTDTRLAFLIKPRLNFRIEAGLASRSEVNTLGNTRTTWLTLGLRSAFRNLYQDF